MRQVQSTLSLAFFLILIVGFTSSCSKEQKVEGDGPLVEIEYLRMEGDDPVCMIKNRSDKTVTEIRGDFVFTDEEGKPLINISLPKDFPFMYVSNSIVTGGHQKEIELPIIMDDDAVGGYVVLDIVRFEDGSAFKPKK